MRPYQLAAVTACRGALEHASGRAVIAMPSGTGAMRTAVTILGEVEAPVSLVLVHRRDQLHQAVHQLQVMLPNADVGVIADATRPVQLQRVLFATVACARRVVADGYLCLDDIGLVVLNECHRSVGPLLSRYQGRLLGLTDLVDRQTLERVGVSEPGFVYTYSQAVKDGFLVPFHVNSNVAYHSADAIQRILAAKMASLGELAPLPYKGRFVLPDLARRVSMDLVEHVLKDESGLPGATVVVVPDRSAAQTVVDALNGAFGVPGIAASITSGSTEAWKIVERFRANGLPRLAVVVDQHEAVSNANVQAVVLLRPVRSRRLFYSLLGIGARPATGKTSFTVFDYVGAFEWHRSHFE